MSRILRSLSWLLYATVPILTIFMLSKCLVILMPSVALLINPVLTSATPTTGIDLSYHPPSVNIINSLPAVLNSTGVFGFVFDSSQTSSRPYSTYNWCNMPHVRPQEYIIPPADFSLKYVEVIHRHHKRTPYAANTFPGETQTWNCTNTALFNYGQPNFSKGNVSAPVFRRFYRSEINPYTPAGSPPHTCEFPQITLSGLDDALQHGKDLYGVYNEMLGLIPKRNPLSAMIFRVTNNPITSQVVGMLISGMVGSPMNSVATPLYIQPPDVDSLEPRYPCNSASSLYSRYGPGSSNPAWTMHLNLTKSLFAKLDSVSGIEESNSQWHISYDHYFDNLSSRLCHQKTLPCNTRSETERCIERKDADKVFRLGEYEYAFTYRSAGKQTLEASSASFGVWTAELASHLRTASDSSKPLDTVYRHYVAHDGSLARLLSILQLDMMVWPGMGSEVVFELYSKGPGHYVRILWSGLPLKSSTPTLQAEDHMIPVERLLGYFDGLVGKDAELVKGLCKA